MWWLFSRILLLSLLQYAAKADRMEDCPANQVCTVFGTYLCKVNGVLPAKKADNGFLYEDSTSCDRSEYTEKHHARLDIEPVSLHNWSFVMNHWERHAEPGGDPFVGKFKEDGTWDNPQIYNIGFDFGSAKLTFPNGTRVKFDWRKSDDAEWKSSSFPLKFEKKFLADYFTYMQYSFKIASDEKLANLFGKRKFFFIRSEHNFTTTFDDPRFVELLSLRSPCDPEELSSMEACHGGCDTLQFSNETKDVTCSSNASIWFHDKNEAVFTRHWQPAKEIKCWLGSYKAQWDGGFQVLEPSMEVQCSMEKPAKWMALGIGMMVGSGVLFVIIAGVIAFFVCRSLKRKHNDTRSHSDAPTFSTPSTPGLYRPPSIQSKQYPPSVPVA